MVKQSPDWSKKRHFGKNNVTGTTNVLVNGGPTASSSHSSSPIFYEKEFELKPSVNEVYYTSYLISLVKKSCVVNFVASKLSI